MKVMRPATMVITINERNESKKRARLKIDSKTASMVLLSERMMAVVRVEETWKGKKKIAAITMATRTTGKTLMSSLRSIIIFTTNTTRMTSTMRISKKTQTAESLFIRSDRLAGSKKQLDNQAVMQAISMRENMDTEFERQTKMCMKDYVNVTRANYKNEGRHVSNENEKEKD